jgi:hypothetical protein
VTLLLSCEAKEEGGTTIERRNTGEDKLATLARRMIDETDHYTSPGTPRANLGRRHDEPWRKQARMIIIL